jgi:hypothetical protein
MSPLVVRTQACKAGQAPATCLNEKQIAAVSGHKSLREVQRYTEAADQRWLARDAMGNKK